MGAPSDYPLIVTVGPQCSGKTTFVLAQGDNYGGARICDVAIDEHPKVYHKLPTSCVLDMATLPQKLDVKLFDKSVSERMAEDPALAKIMVARRLAKLTSAEEFAAQWASRKELHPKPDPEVDATWVAAVEAAVASGLVFTSATVDLFVPSGLYPHAVLDTARQLRRECERHAGAVAWSNTNTKTKDYRDALKAAQKCGRPVRFVRWKHELPEVPLQELFARNLRRFAHEGRYIPPHALAAADHRVTALYARTQGGASEQLADVAGFEMLPDGRVKPHGRLMVPRPTKRKAAEQPLAASPLAAAVKAATAAAAAAGEQSAAGDSHTANSDSDKGRTTDRSSRKASSDSNSALQFSSRWSSSDLWGTTSSGGVAVASAGALLLPQPGVIDAMQDALSRAASAALRFWEGWAGGTVLYRGGRLREAQQKELTAPAQLSKQWAKMREWRHNKWTREDIEPAYMYLGPRNDTNSTGTGTRKTTEYDLQPDTIDVVRVIKGDRNARYKF